MIDCEHYQNYKGPNLTLAQIWKKGCERQDITENIKQFYGENVKSIYPLSDKVFELSG